MLSSPLREASLERLSSVTEQQALLFAQAFHAVGYSDKAVADSFGGVEMRGRGGRNLPRLLYLTAKPRP